MQRIHADPSEQERILPLQESLRPHAARTTTLRRIHVQRRDFRRTIIGSGERLGITGDRQHHCAGCGEQPVITLLIRPRDLPGLNRIECDDMAAFRKPDTSHTAGSAPLGAHIARIIGQQ